MKPRLLVIEDDYSVLAALDKLLQREGYETLLARTGSEAIGMFTISPVDLIILDLNLGEETGWSFLDRMNRINPSVPTIIVTAEFGQRARAIAAGANELIEKPLDVPRFLEIICNVLAGRNKTHFNDESRPEGHCGYVAELEEPLVRLLAERRSTPLALSKALRSVLECRKTAAEPHTSARPSSTDSNAFKSTSGSTGQGETTVRPLGGSRWRRILEGCRETAGSGLRARRRGRSPKHPKQRPKSPLPNLAVSEVAQPSP